MIALAIDTCFSQCAAGIMVGSGAERSVFIERAVMDKGHAEALLPMVERAAVAAAVELTKIERIAVTIGPGTFTGIRTGVAAARALALATGAAIVPVTSLLALAGGVLADQAVKAFDGVLACADARKDQVYVQVIGIDGVEVGPAQVVAATDAANLEPQRRLIVVGRGAMAVHAAARSLGRDLALHSTQCDATFAGLPDLDFMLRTLAVRPAADRPSPLYLRPPDAKPQADKSLPWSKP